MLWSRAKTIMIIFLLCINILLLNVLLISEHKRKRIPDDVIVSCAEILGRRGIEIDTQIIPKYAETAHQYTVANHITDYETFAKKVLGEGIAKTEDGYATENAEISFCGDVFRIKFYDGFETGDKHRAPAEKLRAYLARTGIDASDTTAEVTNDANGIFTVTLEKEIGGAPLFDCKITADFSGRKITEIYGSWFEEISGNAATYETESAPGLLVGYASSGGLSAGTRIIGVKFGYRVNEDGVYHMQSTLTPVYELLAESGEKFYIDARLQQ